jgi:hypothetical protein
MPEHVVHLKTTEENFNIINKKILQKVKEKYLVQKKEKTGAHNVQLTDDDLVPLALLKVAMEELDRKFEVKARLWADLISELRSEIEKKKKQI